MDTTRNPVGWFEIYVQDMDRAKTFYEGTFQVTLTRLGSPEPALWAFPGGPMQPGATGALVQMDGKDAGPGGTLVYFSCEDCAEQAALAVQLGGTLHKPKTSIGEYGFIALVVDPEGNMFGLHSME